MTRVLLAEDNLTLLENIALELELRGYEVLQATNGQGALNILRTSTQLPDIVVSDIAMPDVDGFQLLEHLRSDPKWNGIPCLFLTAFDSLNYIRLSKELGVDDYIVKPFKADDLIIAMENKLKRIAAFEKQAELQLDAARQTLLNMISHELRTPLTAIYGGSEMLEQSLVDVPDETVKSLMELVRGGANRLHRLVEQTLILLQIDSGYLKKAYQQSRRPYTVDEVVMSAIDTIQNRHPDNLRHLEIEYSKHPDTLCVEGIMNYLVLMIEEPLRNAFRFSPQGATVEVAVHMTDHRVTIAIQDYGPGIPQADIARIWDRFTQLDRDVYEQQGAGLGLTIARESARAHGGDCIIESQSGKGTQVNVILPLCECE